MRITNLSLMLFYMNNYYGNKQKSISTPNILSENNYSKNVFNNINFGDRNIPSLCTYNNRGIIKNSSKNLTVADLYRAKTTQEILDETPEYLKYKGNLSAEEISKKWISTGEITAQENDYLATINGDLWCESSQKSQLARTSKRVNEALSANNITLNPDEEFKLSITNDNKITVSGMSDTEKEHLIQEALQSNVVKFKYTSCCLASGLFGTYLNSSQTYANFSPSVKSLTLATLTASTFLYNQTGGKVTLDDLTINNGKIEGLPQELSDMINGDNKEDRIVNGTRIEAAKLCINIAKEHATKYGKENLPNVTATYTYKNGHLIVIEDSEAAKKAAKF